MLQQIPDEEILLKAQGGKREPFLGLNGLYNILYKTVFTVNGKIYIGVHSSKEVLDSYIGCGIDRSYSSELTSDYSSVSFVGLVKRYGVGSFLRENLLYFNSVDEALLCEKSIVDRKWVLDTRTLNLRVGGYKPPTLRKEKNGNYQNFWSKEQREKLSRKRKEGGRTKGSLNGNSKPVVFVDIYTNEERTFKSAREAYEILKPKSDYYTLLTFILEKKIYDRRWVCFWLEDYLKNTDTSSYIERLIENSRFKKQILIKRNDCKKH